MRRTPKSGCIWYPLLEELGFGCPACFFCLFAVVSVCLFVCFWSTMNTVDYFGEVKDKIILMRR